MERERERERVSRKISSSARSENMVRVGDREKWNDVVQKTKAKAGCSANARRRKRRIRRRRRRRRMFQQKLFPYSELNNLYL